MLFWFDAVTAKEPLLFNAIAKELEKEGHEVVFTCREYDYVVSLFQLLNREVEVLGKHGGGTLAGKMRAGVERMHLLLEYITSLDRLPDYHIAFACPESIRVAFGLAIPVLCLNDSPHARAVGKLTVPLSKYLIFSKSIPEEEWVKLGGRKEQFVPYKGIDEVAWLRNHQPDEKVLETVNLKPNENFIVARPEESSAAYLLDKKMIGDTKLDIILKKILQNYDGKVIVFPRYETQKVKMCQEFGDRIIIPPKAVDTTSLYYFADVCITGGATMAREAAAMGTPSVSYFPEPLPVLENISKIGIPLYNEYTVEDAIKRVEKLLKNKESKEKRREKVNKILTTLESPHEPIMKLIKNA